MQSANKPITRRPILRLALAALAVVFGLAGLKAGAQPANDNFANALGLSGQSGTVVGSNVGATSQPGEPSHAPGNSPTNSIWYTWTAPVTGWVEFTTAGSVDPLGNQLDTVMAAYTGFSLQFLSQVANNDDNPGGTVTSRIDFLATAGTTYYIAVDSFNDGLDPTVTGTVQLNWKPAIFGGSFQWAIDPQYNSNSGVTSSVNWPTPSVYRCGNSENFPVTVARVGGYDGRVSVDYVLSSIPYVDTVFNFVVGTNVTTINLTYNIVSNGIDANSNAIFSTNLVGIVGTNTVVSNAISVVYFEDNLLGKQGYMTNYAGSNYFYTNVLSETVTSTNTALSNFLMTDFITGKFGTNYVTNLLASIRSNDVVCELRQFVKSNGDVVPCPGPVSALLSPSAITNSDTNIVIMVSNTFCSQATYTYTVDSVAGATTLGTGTLTFDDYEMTKNFYIPTLQTIGPNRLSADVNRTLMLTLTNPRLDPQESRDVTVPVINPTNGTASVCIVDLETGVNQDNCTVTSNSVVNFAQAWGYAAEDLVSGGTGFASSGKYAYPLYHGGNLQGGETATWSRQNTLIGLDTDNQFPLTPMSDYGKPPIDSTAADSPNTGTATWANNRGGTTTSGQVTVRATNDMEVEFNEDYNYTLTGASGGVVPVTGYLTKMNITIYSFDQPAGANDYWYNMADNSSSYPPFNANPGANAPVHAVVLTPDGLSVIGGEFNSYDGAPCGHLLRLDLNGQPDATFAGAGSGANGVIAGLALDLNANILAVGSFTSFNGSSRYGIVRLAGNGAIDPTFSPSLGARSGSQPNSPGGAVSALALQADGKIIIGGDFTYFNGTATPRIARVNPDGSLDTTFNPGAGANGSVYAVAVLPNGKILLGGSFTMVNGTNSYYLARLNSDGSLDTTLNIGTGLDSTVYAMAPQLDNRIIIGGAFTVINRVSRNGIARLNADGSLDASFDPGVGADDVVYALTLQPDGQVLVGGRFQNYNRTRRVGIARLFTDGAVDTSFMDTAYNQYAGLINHYHSTTAVNPSDFPTVNTRNFVLAVGVDAGTNVYIGGSFQRVGGGFGASPRGYSALTSQPGGYVTNPRDATSPRGNFARLIGRPTTGPGNIKFTQKLYSADENGLQTFISLQRTHGSLGVVGATISTNLAPAGPGAITGRDLTFSSASYGSPFYDIVWNYLASPYSITTYGWMLSDGFTNYSYFTEPTFEVSTPYVFININDNKIVDGNRTAGLELLYPHGNDLFYLGGGNVPLGVALEGGNTSTLEIIDDDISAGIFGFSAPSFYVNENGTNALITVTRFGGSQGQVSVNYNTANGTAIAGTKLPADYVGTSGTLAFSDGVTNLSFSIPIINNTLVQSNRTVYLQLSNPTGRGQLSTNTVNPANAVLTIIDDDFPAGHLDFSATNYNVHEMDGSVSVTVSRTGGTIGTLSVQYFTSDGSALNGVNYVGTNGLLSWNSGESTPRVITFPIIHDFQVTPNLRFNVMLTNAMVAGSNNPVVLGYNHVTNAAVTVINDDAYGKPVFLTPNYNVFENAGVATVLVLRTGGTAGSVSINYATSDQTAVSGVNYIGTNGVLTFAPGETAKSFSFPVIDRNSPTNVTLTLTLFNPSQPSLASSYPKTATLTLVGDLVQRQPAGSIDPTFKAFPGANNLIHALALQPDGNVLVGGDFTLINQVPRNRIARLTTDGTTDGQFMNNFSGADGSVWAIVSQTPASGFTDGPIMIGGTFTNVDGLILHNIARLNLDGGPDSTFNPGSGFDNGVFALAETFVNGAREMLVAGNFANYNGVARNGIVRLNDDGSVDFGFDPGVGISSTAGTIYAIAVQADGRVVIGGDFTSFAGTTHNHLARLNLDGTVDQNFNPSLDDSVRTLAIQPDGKILVGGLFATVNGISSSGIARLNADGTLDSTYTVGAGADLPVLAVSVDANLNTLAAGEFTRASSVTRNRLTRLTAFGTVDPSINFGLGADDFISCMVLQPDGNFIIGGGFHTYDGATVGGFARVFGGAIAGNGSLEFSAPNYQVMENGSNAVITVRRVGATGTTGLAAAAQVVTSDLTAHAGTDYQTLTNGLVSFPVGETFATVLVPILQNLIIAPDKTVQLSLAGLTNVGVGPQPTALLTIINNNEGVNFSAAGYRVSKNVQNGAAFIPILRQGYTNDTMTVQAATVAGGTAVPGGRYVPATDTLVFPPGVNTLNWTVNIINDNLVEGDQTVQLALMNSTNGYLLAPSAATLTIVETTTAPGNLEFSAGSYSVVKSGRYAILTVVRTNGSSGPVSVQYATSDGTAQAGTKYVATNGTVAFSSGETSKAIQVEIIPNNLVDGNQTFYVTLATPQGGASLIDPTTVPVTIIDNNQGVAFGAPAYFVNELTNAVTLSVVRTGSSLGALDISYATSDGGAHAGTNYVAASGVLHFASGENLKTLPVSILHDGKVAGNLDFSVKLSNVVSTNLVQLGTPSTASVVIVDSDTGFSLSSSTYSGVESSLFIPITVNRLGSLTGTQTVSFATADGTALHNVRYLATNGVLTFPDGVSSQTFFIPLINDTIVQGNQTLSVGLFAPSAGAQLLSGPNNWTNATVSIIDDDVALAFASTAISASECGVRTPVTVVRTGLTTGTVTIDFATADGSGVAGQNYLPTAGTLVFGSGVTSQTFYVTNIDDSTINGDKTVLINLSNPTGGASLSGPPTASITLLECDGSLVAPAGSSLLSESLTPTNNVIDPGETVTLLLGLRCIAGGNTSNLVATLVLTNGISTNGVTGAVTTANYGVLVQNGHTINRSFTFKNTASVAGQLTVTLHLQDGPRDLGIASFAYAIGSTSASFAAPGLITINDNSAATPYPSTNLVSGLSGNVSRILVTLSNITHTSMSDINALVVSPAGQKSVVVSHVGGSQGVNHLSLTLDDNASAFLPLTTATTLVSGTNKPTVSGFVPPFPVPAPAGPYATNMAALTGGNPNGPWQLFVLDDKSADFGWVSNGWSLTLLTSSTITPQADLEVTATASAASITLSNQLSYTIGVTNYGPSPASGVVLADTLPAGAAFVSCTFPGSMSNGVFTTTATNLSLNSGFALTLVIQANVAGTATNLARATSTVGDLNPGNSVATNLAVVVTPTADLGVTLSGTPDPLPLGSLLTYFITVTNNGPSTATGVVVVNTLPAGMNLVSNAASAGSVTNASGVVTWTLDSLTATNAATLSLGVTPTVPGILTDSASVSSAVLDPLKFNNSVAVKTEVDFTMGAFRSGSALTLTWPATATNLVVQTATSLSPPVNWVTVTSPAPTLVGTNLTFSVIVSNNAASYFRLQAPVQ